MLARARSSAAEQDDMRIDDGARSESSSPEGDEQLVELTERLVQRIGRAGAGGVERFLRRVELAQRQQGVAVSLLERHGGDGSAVATLLVGPHQARIRN